MPLGFVVSMNLNRRHLTESQRAMVAASLANMTRTETLVQNRSANLHNDAAQVSQSQAAELLQVSQRSVATAAKVERTAPDEVIEAVKAGVILVPFSFCRNRQQTVTITRLPSFS